MVTNEILPRLGARMVSDVHHGDIVPSPSTNRLCDRLHAFILLTCGIQRFRLGEGRRNLGFCVPSSQRSSSVHQ
jgi:hypothetical protein